MHRSGTSVFTQLVSSLGFDAGSNLMPADSDNQTGYWEDMDIFRLNNEILSYMLLSWHQVEDLENRRIEILHRDLIDLFGDRAQLLINRKLKSSDNVIVKDPRFCILMPFWNTILKEVSAEIQFFNIIRDPLSVALSINKRNGITIHNGLLLWYYYNYMFVNEVLFPCHFISFHNLLYKPETIQEKLNGLFDRNIAAEYFAAIKPELEHFVTNNENLINESSFFPKIQLMWKHLSEQCNKHSAYIQNDFSSVFFEPDFKSMFEADKKLRNPVNMLFYRLDKKEIAKTHSLGYVQGMESLTFETGNNAGLFTGFDVHLFDHACKIKIIETKVFTAEESFITEPYSGNYIFKNNYQFYFISNQPCIRYTFEKGKPVERVSIQLSVESFDQQDKDVMLSTLQITNKRALDNQKSTEEKIDILQKTINKNTSELLSLKIKVEEQQREILHLNNELERNTEEKKELENKNQWFEIEINQLLNSISWKITKPFRKVLEIIRLSRNRLIILLRDFYASLGLLRREGISSFIYRLGWYIRGKRHMEDIETVLNNNAPCQQPEAFDINQLEVLHFVQVENPLVSIVIPVYNQFICTYRCLQSIKKHTDGFGYEIIIIDDHSTDKSPNISEYVKGIRYVKNDTNLGFLKSCNTAVTMAQGAYICMLNNDTEVSNDWLFNMVETIEKHDKAGLVGSKLLFPDGRLQEAGGIIWNDASGWNFGKFDDPDKPAYNYLKEVDYVSGACMLIRADLWEKLNGFDEQFSPAYYEDTDLAFRIRESGFKVVYQPQASIIHYEGRSHGTDEEEGIKKFQAINRKKFLDKWQQKLRIESSPNGHNSFFHRDRSMSKKHILVIDHYVPMHDQDAGSRSTFNYLKLFLKMGYQVHFLGDNFFKQEPYTSHLQQLGIEVLYGNFMQQNIREWFRENGKYLDIIITHRSHIAPKYFSYIKNYCNTKVAYIGHDLQYLGSKKQYELTGDKFYLKESQKFYKTEHQIFNSVDIVFPFSTYEEPFIKAMAPNKTIRTIPVYFFRNLPDDVPGYDERSDILFVGYFGHPPNPDAIIWFIKEVFPEVKKLLPEVKINIVGSSPTDEVKMLNGPDISVTGYVADDELIRYYRNCRISVLPLRFGAGVKGKLLESMYHQLPAVITTVSAEGVPAIENHCMIADDAYEFADKIFELYTDKATWYKYSNKGKELIENHFMEDTARKILEDVFEKQ